MILLVLSLLTLATLVWLYVFNSQRYWEKRNVPTLPGKFPYGHFNPKISHSLNLTKLYNEFKASGNNTHGGVYFFTTPSYMPFDTDIIKNILMKDHSHFVSRGMYTNPNQPISEHLFSLSGEKWKFMRTKLSPTFTSGKMKKMFEILDSSTTPLVDRVSKSANSYINIKDALMRYTIDFIGNAAFGLECNSFGAEDPQFLKVGLQAVRQGTLRDIQFIMATILPKLAKAFNFQVVPSNVNKFYYDIAEEICEQREKSGVVRNDFIQSLIELKNAKVEENDEAFTMDMIRAQTFVFFLAGFETSSSTMTFALYELAKHPDIQNRVREEIRDVLKKHNGQFTYDSILEMKYLSQVIEETLRIYPVVPFLQRKCTATYREPKTGLLIEKGTQVAIPILGMHHDPENFPNPEVFNPDRFSEENKRNIKPYTWMPFGEGNMLCIGMRFGLMQTRLGLSKILENHNFSLNNRTKTSLEYDTTLLLIPKEDVYLDVKKAD